jgi:hypothetical protein
MYHQYTNFPVFGVKSFMPLTFLSLEDYDPFPEVKMDLPPLRLGDRITLRFPLTRQNNGRREVLEVNGEYQVTALRYDASGKMPRMRATVASTASPPHWRAVRQPTFKGALAPAVSPRTPIPDTSS